ncbi:zinc finger BED domain-containing protein RICESLEEPER 2-like protein, partial [Tanacetum coccineum]
MKNCLIEWGLKNILTITVDSASSNDKAIDYLKGKLVKWGDNCILKGKWTHVRCFAHILNLVVQDRLKELEISVNQIRAVVRWIRLSPTRIIKFSEFCIFDNFECEKSLVVDVPTRWNSIYLMLSVAIEYERSMSVEMMKGFDKYWGDTKKFNMLVFITLVFDPRTKFEYLKQHLKNATSSSHISHNQSSSSIIECLDTGVFGVFEDTIETMRKKNIAKVKRRKKESGIAKETKTELDRYLTEEIEGDNVYFESDNFTVLGWWKKRILTFLILSLVARDILVIPVSTVASESTFSTGGRVLDSFRTSLTSQIVEALICCQDWIRSSHALINVEEKIEDLEKFEEELGPVCDGYIIVYGVTLVFGYQLFLLLPALLVILCDLDTMCKALFLK